MLTLAEREAIAYELAYEVPEHQSYAVPFDWLQSQFVPQVLFACVRNAQLRLDRAADLEITDEEVIEWIGRRVFQTTLENVADGTHHGDDEYWATWTSLENKFGLDRRAIGGHQQARDELLRFCAETDGVQPAGLRRVVDQVAEICGLRLPEAAL